MKDLITHLSIVAVVLLVGILSAYLFGNDNPLEEISEEIIKEETGLEIDLTPSSLENPKEDLSFLTKYRFSR